jgi:ubiquinone/menaquinone biosynthesis C-methylase UbiE
MLDLIDQLSLLHPGDRVLDVGCGPGAMVQGLLERVGRAGSYVGVDVHLPSIEWCRRRYSADGRCRFETVDVASPYGSGRGGNVSDYSFPATAGDADFVLAKSLFTHLSPPETTRYLAEIRRVLRPSRAAVLTAFLFAPGSRTAAGESRFFRCADESGRFRWRSGARPRSAVAYERSYFYELVEKSGLRVQWVSPGFFPGDAQRLTGQDVLVLGH